MLIIINGFHNLRSYEHQQRRPLGAPGNAACQPSGEFSRFICRVTTGTPVTAADMPTGSGRTRGARGRRKGRRVFGRELLSSSRVSAELPVNLGPLHGAAGRLHVVLCGVGGPPSEGRKIPFEDISPGGLQPAITDSWDSWAGGGSASLRRRRGACLAEARRALSQTPARSPSPALKSARAASCEKSAGREGGVSPTFGSAEDRHTLEANEGLRMS